MRRARAVLLLALAMTAAAARAQDAGPIDATGFETLTTGRTLTFALGGSYYGAEQYLPERKVIWRLGNGGCVAGEWFARDDGICFAYDAIAGEQCWRFTRRQGRVHASSLSGALDLEVTGSSEQPLTCPGPDMGV